jgi:flagellar protein FliO/FliZ
MPASWMPLLWFGVIVVLIPAALWLLKHTPLGGGGSAHLLRSVAVLPLSASQRVAIVEVGAGAARRWLVLGVSAAGIHTLHSMEPQGDAGLAQAEPAATFAQLLSRLRRGP